jgi:hypothetical protein
MEATVSTPTSAAAEAAPITTILRGFGLPAIGTHWTEKGGIFAGILRGLEGGPDVALIVAAGPVGRFEDREWGAYGTTVAGADSYHDGRSNSVAMAEAGSKLAQEILDLDTAGFADWYLPSQAELQLCSANLRDHFEKGDWYWTSTQCSPNCAWVQGFEGGYSNVSSKRGEFRAVAVRRFVL